MKKRIFTTVALAVMTLSGCASYIMDGYTGKSINEVMMDYGKPAFVLDMPNNQKAFGWSMTHKGYVPQTTTFNATHNASVFGNQAFGSTHGTATTTGGFEVSRDCNYVFYAKPEGSDWIVTGYREPNIMCE